VSFTLPKGARDFFGFEGQRAFARRGPLKRDTAGRFLLFDAYYCCALLGLDSARLGDDAELEGASFLAAYPEAYKGQAEIVAGLLVDAELRRLGINSDDRQDVEGKMVELLDLTSPSRLSVKGDNLLNLYAVTGFDRLQAGMLEPDTVEDFIVGYQRLWVTLSPLAA
jgi:hypothetical protein